MSTEMKKELPWWQKYTLTLNEEQFEKYMDSQMNVI